MNQTNRITSMASNAGYRPGEDRDLDPGIREYVRILREEGVETFESCQGGRGHCFPEPTIRFFGGHHEGFRAFAAAKMRGLPVAGLRRYYQVVGDELEGPWWEMTFHATGQA